MDTPLAPLSAFTAQLAALTEDPDAATTLDDLAAIDKKAEVLRHMAQVAKAGLQWQNWFAAMRFRSMKKIGGVLHEMPKAAGGRPPSEPDAKPLPGAEGLAATLRELGFSYNYSSQCQKIYAAPDAVFDSYLRQGTIASDDDQEVVVELTKAGLLGWIARDAPKSDYSEKKKTITSGPGSERSEADRRKSEAAPAPSKTPPPKPPPPTPTPLTGDAAELVAGITKILDGPTPKREPGSQSVRWDMKPGLLVVASLAVRKVDVFDTLATTPKADAINGLCNKLDYSYNEIRTDLDDDEPEDYSDEVQKRRDDYEQWSLTGLDCVVADQQPALYDWLKGAEPETEDEAEALAAFDTLGVKLVAQLDNLLCASDGDTIGRAIWHLDLGEFEDIADVYCKKAFEFDSIDEMHDALTTAERERRALQELVPELVAERDALRQRVAELETRIADLEGTHDKS